MKKTADALYVAICYSLQGFYVEKALLYSELAMALCPSDQRLREVHCYALILQGNYEEAEQVLQGSAFSQNMRYLKARLGILKGLSVDERRTRIREALTSSL